MDTVLPILDGVHIALTLAVQYGWLVALLSLTNYLNRSNK